MIIRFYNYFIYLFLFTFEPRNIAYMEGAVQ